MFYVNKRLSPSLCICACINLRAEVCVNQDETEFSDENGCCEMDF